MGDFYLGQPIRFTWSLVRVGDHKGMRKWVTSGEASVWNYGGKPLPEPSPVDGLIMGKRTLYDGIIETVKESDGYGYTTSVSNQWCPQRHFQAYLVVSDLRTKPVFVLPEHITPIP